MGKLLRDSGQVGRAGTLALSSRPAGREHTHAGAPVREACCCHTGAVPLHGTASVTAAQLQTFISSSNQMHQCVMMPKTSSLHVEDTRIRADTLH